MSEIVVDGKCFKACDRCKARVCTRRLFQGIYGGGWCLCESCLPKQIEQCIEDARDRGGPEMRRLKVYELERPGHHYCGRLLARITVKEAPKPILHSVP